MKVDFGPHFEPKVSLCRKMADVLEVVELLERAEEVEELAQFVGNVRKRYIRDKDNPMEFYNDIEFKKRFRFDKETVLEIAHLFEDRLTKLNNRGLPVPPIIQLLTALRFYATGNFQLVTADLQGISQSTVSRIVKKISIMIAQLRPHYVKFPSREEGRTNSLHFFQTARFPGVLGAIDGTHVPIMSPGGEYGEVFRNRKTIFTLNCQGIVDQNRKFIDFVTGWPGSTHDNRMFNSSRICAQFERGEHDGILLGDSGYACRPFVLTPLLNPQTESEEAYNVAHKRARNIVERTFGCWKKKFPCLSKKFSLTKLETVTTVIVATVVLHNIAADHGLLEEPLLHEVENEDEGHHPPPQPLGAIARRAIIQQYF
ncbi:putative nuclease HARBI1 [Periplaneta americana]|uniref:putative nuclease HARBI1 n=1 Tax=Periplaneta americana TaxID=6978 RepID=UPI0037E9C041